MHYLIIAHDGTDENAPDRRLAARDRHLASIERLKAEGKALYGAAILDNAGTMRGSILIVNFPSDEKLREYLASDPYVTGHVWEQVEVKPCRVPPVFLNT
jgi:uncharacterized protein YciI